MAAGENHQNKAELLKQLVNEDQKAETAVEQGQLESESVLRGWRLALLVALVALLLAAVVMAFLPSTPATISKLADTNGNSQAVAPAVKPSIANPSTAEPSVKPALNPGAILNASGYITARRVATVSAETMGLITEVTVDEGMHVEAQQVLARLDDRKAVVNLQLAQARVKSQKQNIKSIESDLLEAERVFSRLTQLGQENFTSEAERTRAETDVVRLKANLASAKAELEVSRLSVAQARENLDDHTIRAPFSGVITVKNAQPGEIVAPAAAGGGFTRTGICTLVDMNSLEIQVDVNEAYIGRVQPGQKVIANLDAYPKWDIPASVIAIIPTANRAKATVQVRIKISQPDSRILPNMGVKVAFFDELVTMH